MKSDTYVKIIKWGIYLCLLLPLFVSRQFYFPFVFPRTAVFRILIEILFIFWLILVFKDKRYLPPINAVFLSLAVLSAVFLLTTFTSVDPTKSFLGTMERGGGVFTWLHYFVFFVILTGVFRQKKDWLDFLNLTVGASLLVSLYALAQRLGLESVYESGVDRATGTIGNAAFLASYLILNLGFCFVLLFSRENENRRKVSWKIFYYSSIFFSLIAIYLSGTRGAILGLLAGFFIFVLLYVFFAPDDNQLKRKKYFIAALVLLIIFAGFLWAAKDSAVIQKIPGLSRLARISLSEATAQTRILAWKVAWEGWKEKFFFGWGPENFNIVFNKYAGPEFYKFGGGETWFDRAHNIVFEVGSTSGFIGAFAYLAVFVAAYYSLWQIKQRQFLSTILLIAFLSAYFVQDLLVFDVFNSYLLFFTILAFVSFLAGDSLRQLAPDGARKVSQADKDAKKVKKHWRQKELGTGAAIGLILISLIISIFLWQYNYKALAAGFWSAQAFKNSRQPQAQEYLKSPERAEEAFNKIINLYHKTFSFQTYGDPEIRTDFLTFILINTENENISVKTREKTFEFAISQARQSIKECPLNARWHLMASKILEGGAQLQKINKQDNSALLKEAEETINQGISLAPSKIALQYILVQILLMQEKSEEGLVKAHAIVEAYPDLPDSYWYLSLAYIAVDDETSALKAIDQALDFGYTFQNIGDLKLALALMSKYNDFVNLEKEYQQAIRLEPKNLQWYASLATVYSKLGQKEKAIETANKIIEIQPESKEQVEDFIKGL